jgi:hypothetical protein
MYAVIRYFNYRKDVSFTALKTFFDLEKADSYALACAKEDYGEDKVFQGVSDKCVCVDGVFHEYTARDGFGRFVYTVMELPEPEDQQEILKDLT